MLSRLPVPNQPTPPVFSPLGEKSVVTTLIIAALFSAASAAEPIKVFILAGQSNMEGQGSVASNKHRQCNTNQK